jgi:hypothetical protein
LLNPTRTEASPPDPAQTGFFKAPLDLLVLLDDGVPGRVELTGMIDVATRTVPAAVLRPTTKSVDASGLLARALTPEPMRPGWARHGSGALELIAMTQIVLVRESRTAS